MNFIQNDGGRAEAGFKGNAGDCVARAVAIASRRPYAEIYAALSKLAGAERKSHGATARNGIHTSRKWFKDFMRSLGFTWTATMGIGTGCKVHLHDGELPSGRLVVAVSKHYTAVIDGVVHDTHNPQRTTMFFEHDQPTRVARRCVYGYWKLA
jgi:hypothetical protein